MPSWHDKLVQQRHPYFRHDTSSSAAGCSAWLEDTAPASAAAPVSAATSARMAEALRWASSHGPASAGRGPAGAARAPGGPATRGASMTRAGQGRAGSYIFRFVAFLPNPVQSVALVVTAESERPSLDMKPMVAGFWKLGCQLGGGSLAHTGGLRTGYDWCTHNLLHRSPALTPELSQLPSQIIRASVQRWLCRLSTRHLEEVQLAVAARNVALDND